MRMSNGIFAMEEAVADLPANQEEAAQTAVAVADETAEIQTDADDIAVSTTEIEDAVQAGDELETIGEVAADSVESGEGLTEEAAEIASIAIESIRHRLGFYEDLRLVPATESFGNTNTRLTSTRLIAEGVSEFVKKIWLQIKAAAARLWDKIKSFFAKIFNSTTLLNKHIASLKDRARNLPSNAKLIEKKVKSSLARSLGVKKTANFKTFSQIATNTVALSAVAGEVSKQSREIVDAAQKLASSSEINEASVSAFLTTKKGVSAKIEEVMTRSFSGADSALSSMNAVIKGKKPKKGATRKSAMYGPFVGAVALTLTVDKGADDVSFYIGFEAAPGQYAEEIELLTVSEVQEVLKTASDVGNYITDLKRTQGNIDAITKQINKVADTVLAQAGNILDKTGSSSATRQGLEELKSNVSETISTMNQFGGRAPALMFALAKAAADYASISIRNLRAA